jgi:dTDP-4-dehydrorhamnose reductase
MTNDQRAATPPLELWGGVECTIVRLHDGYRDQSAETGHLQRPDDIDLIAGLGIRTMRYPILWEKVAPERPDDCDWAWTDERLAMLRERGIRVIGGLLHHGSGPAYTDLLDPDFPQKLADYAARVADRYPWIEMWTPVNEPLTTARFSGLYGHWYPHRRDYPAFLRALVNECKATVEAMRAIRAAVPGARLVQTEDLGKTFSTAPLRYQAAHENERRWLSLDLLCGRVDPRHAFHDILFGAGVGWGEMEALQCGEGTPDLLGINHYLTSERYLDHRLDLYPGHAPGGNRRDTYIDAEAVRVKRLEADTGLGPRLREAWARYNIPIAVTEVHHGCHRDEQLRWAAEVWETAGKLREEGVDLRAVTLWSMFGNVDWRFLLTERNGFYDTGVFDVRGERPRPTVIARAAKAWAAGEAFDHPVLDTPGWWRRPPRLYPWNGRCKALDPDGRKLLITGATGTLGQAFARICEERALPFCLTTRQELDISDEASVAAALERHRPWVIVNTPTPSASARHASRPMPSARRRSRGPATRREFRSSPSRRISSSTERRGGPMSRRTPPVPPAPTASARRRRRGGCSTRRTRRWSYAPAPSSARGTPIILRGTSFPPSAAASRCAPARTPRCRLPTCRISSTRRSTCSSTAKPDFGTSPIRGG